VTTRSPIRVEREGALTVITLDRPDVLNAFDETLTSALSAAVADTGSDASVRAVVITGAGRGFSAGQDLRDRAMQIDAGAELHLGDELRRRYHPLIAAIREMRKRVGDETVVEIEYVSALQRSPVGKLRFVVSEMTN